VTIETRSTHDGYVVRRSRRCGNEHVFSTWEVDGVTYRTITPRKVQAAVDAAQRRVALYVRNRRIVAMLKTESVATVAAAWGLGTPEVYRLRKNWKP
jgi:transcriptional regulator NrdR family protein